MSQEVLSSEILPYQFEPIAPHNWTDEEFSSDSDDSSKNTANEEAHQRLGNVDWCSCSNCKPMTTVPESVCCQENERAIEKAAGAACVTENEDFVAVCTNKAVIETTYNQYLELEKYIDDEPLNDTYRYAAYHQWTFWVHKKLGRKRRVPIPSFVVNKIRNTFPSEDCTSPPLEAAHQ